MLRQWGIAHSSWYHRPVPPEQRKRPGPRPRPIPDAVQRAVLKMATANPWYGDRRIAVMCRRDGCAVKDRQAYAVMKEHGLLQKRRPRAPELHQAAKLFELLPEKPNDLWQMDVTYIHIPGYGWWDAVTVIDDDSRSLLACHLTRIIHKEFNHGDTEDTEKRTYGTNQVILPFTVKTGRSLLFPHQKHADLS